MIHDEFYWISQINKASVVSNSEEKLLDETTAKLAARGIVEQQAEADTSKRVKKYIAYEPMVIAATGPEVTILHAGRSSQDILSTMRVAILREQTIALCEALDAVIGKILALSCRTTPTVLLPSPTVTHTICWDLPRLSCAIENDSISALCATTSARWEQPC